MNPVIIFAHAQNCSEAAAPFKNLMNIKQKGHTLQQKFCCDMHCTLNSPCDKSERETIPGALGVLIHIKVAAAKGNVAFDKLEKTRLVFWHT